MEGAHRVQPEALHVGAAQHELTGIGERHERRTLTDPGALELAIEAQALVAVARDPGARQHGVRLLVAVQREAQLEQPEIEAVGVRIVGMPAREPRVRLLRDTEMLAGRLETDAYADGGALLGER